MVFTPAVLQSYIDSQIKQDTEEFVDEHTHNFFIGLPSSGKTSIIRSILEGTIPKEVKPSCVLEYYNGRKVLGAAKKAIIAHFWEIGGGIQHLNVLNESLNVDELDSTNIYLIVSLQQVFHSFETLVKAITVIKQILHEKN
eukprot:TRINITY_DN2879_c0_g1_i2.p1 TRINITY_DN2879_c0_g1~~TRINITY_DN2879_c0_g1_i2.p1  ORF type:complete len:151 (-),score=33.79 TRINITY_DN2879_c0_g1_i2:200-622(-)